MASEKTTSSFTLILPSSVACRRGGQTCITRWSVRILIANLLFYIFYVIYGYISLNQNAIVRSKRTVDNTNKLYHNGSMGANKMKDTIKMSSILTKSSNKIINLECYSSRDEVYVSSNGVKLYRSNSPLSDGRGIHLVVLNQYNGGVMVTKVFDTLEGGFQLYMVEYLSTIRDGMILVFLVKDEASLNLRRFGREALTSHGSRLIYKLGWRDTWAFISQKGKGWKSEGYNKSPDGNEHAKSVKIKATITLDSMETFCEWGSSLAEKKRSQFCFKYVGYHSLCDCIRPSPIQFKSSLLFRNRLASIPISIIASNRPHYLYKMLSILLLIPGVHMDMITVYIDGYYDEPAAVADLLDIKFVEHVPVCRKACRIHQHYKHALDDTFRKYPNAEYMVILEEDLEVAEDIMDYFSQMLPVLASDQSIYCLSAWNDNSYKHSCNDPSMVYRIEGMPGLGWVLKRELYINELQAKWPGIGYTGDWDLWMRTPSVRKGRECIIPDISRTFHFGKIGLHVNSYTSHDYNESLITTLNKHNGNIFDIKKITKDGYEEDVNNLIKYAELLDHTKNPCNNTDFVPNSKDRVYVLYIKWAYKGDTETWLNVAECFNLWHMDIRGVHKLMWRFWIKRNEIFVVGSRSPYVIHKPSHIEPLYLSDEMVRKKRGFQMFLAQGYTI